MPKPHPVVYRSQASARMDEGRIGRDAATSLRIAESCLHRWRRQERIDQGLASGGGYADRSDLAAAMQRIRDLEEEV